MPLAPLHALLGNKPTVQQLSAFLLQTPLRPENLPLLEQHPELQDRLVAVLSLPEYQLA